MYPPRKPLTEKPREKTILYVLKNQYYFNKKMSVYIIILLARFRDQ